MFEVICGSDFFYGNTKQLFTCTFYCITENGAFPDNEWTDFAQTVLSWWGEEILRITYANEATFKLLFEDGPFWISGKKVKDEVVLHFETDRRYTTTLPDIRLEFYELASAIEKAMRRLATSLFMDGNNEDSQWMQDWAAQIKNRILKQLSS